MLVGRLPFDALTNPEIVDVSFPFSSYFYYLLKINLFFIIKNIKLKSK